MPILVDKNIVSGLDAHVVRPRLEFVEILSEIRNLQGHTLPPPANIVPGTSDIINGNFYVDNEIYDLTNVIVAVRGTAYFDGGAFRNTAPCEGSGNYKLGFYATEDLYVRDVATGVDLIGGKDELIG